MLHISINTLIDIYKITIYKKGLMHKLYMPFVQEGVVKLIMSINRLTAAF
jgi:hypothetical protein